jgi:hypothetical protein
MSILRFLPFFLTFVLTSGGQQLGLQEKPERYLIMEIGAANTGGQFEFTLVSLARSGKECDLRKLDCKTPYTLSVFDEGFFILYGKSGAGKIVTRYKMLTGEKVSYQYLLKGESVVIEFLPKYVGGGSTKWWSEGGVSAPRISMTVMSNEPKF